jgi:gliding motility-associated-like protein
LYIPNSFTPNGDGLNDIFSAVGYNIVEFEMLIFNRWGEKIFQSDNINFGWNGSYLKGNAPNQGDKVQEEVFVYKLKFIDISGLEHTKEGTVTVIY